jgi:hypothetical protein
MIPGGVARYTAADVEHLLRFYPPQEFVEVEEEECPSPEPPPKD